ncbi:fimbrial protein [Klebsiella sp. CN_Kp098]|uniref:fimbrial protein n=1 Tax=unclassified Klebsiella TaxID=2608929 RepID=UPI0032B41234
MKNKKFVLAMMLTAVSSSAFAFGAHAASPVQTGNIAKVEFQGSINAGACDVSPSSADQVVQMGSVAEADFGATSGTLAKTSSPFTLQLSGCDTTVAKNVAVAFQGVLAGTDTNTLAVDNSLGGGTTATGVGIQIYQAGQTDPLKVDGSTFDTKTALTDGNNTLKFSAQYISTSATVTAGEADSSAQINFQYE